MVSEIPEEWCDNGCTAIRADLEEVTTTNLKFSAIQRVESIPRPPYRPDLAPPEFHFFWSSEGCTQRTPFRKEKLKHSDLEEMRRLSKEFNGTGV